MAIVLPIVSNFNKKGITDATTALSSLGDSLKRLGAQVSFAAFMSSSINQARDLQRNIAALEGVFGSYSDRMKNFTVNAQSFGLSQTEAARTSVFLGSVLKSAGFGMGEVADQTEKLTVLAQDLATTYGYDTSEALTAMTALFRGEYDPIEKFGVALKQNEINAIIAAKGLSHLTGVEMLNAQQMVRMEQLYLRTNDAQGAYARQSDSLFVSQQNLTAAFKNLQANAAQPLTIALGKLFAGMVPLVDQAGPALTNTFTQFADILLTLTPLLNPVASLVGSLAEEFNVLIGALSGLIKPFIEPLVGLLQTLTGLLNGLFGFINQNASAIATWGIAIGVVVGLFKTFTIVMSAYYAAVKVAAVAQAVLATAIGITTANPVMVAGALLIIGGGIAAITAAASSAKFEVQGLNSALQTAVNTKIPGGDFSGGSPVGLSPEKIKNPMDGVTTTWFSNGSWWTGSYNAKTGKWSTPKKYTATTSGGGGGGSAKAVTDPIKDYYKQIAEEVSKQSARIRLTNLGASEALIESIIGSGDQWMKLFSKVNNSGKKGVAELQKTFSKTAGGIKEIADAQKEADKKFDESLKDIKERNEKLKATYDEQVKTLDDYKKALKGIISSLNPLAVADRIIGEFEQSAIDSFANISKSIAEGLADKTLTTEAAKTLSDYANKEKALFTKMGLERDALVNRRSLAKALIDDVKSAIGQFGNINTLIEQQSNKVTTTVEKMVMGFKVTTSRTVDEVVGAGKLVSSFQKIVARTKAFAAQLKELRALGLNENLYKQIVDAGVDAGSVTAEEIIKGGAGTIGELNSLFAELNTVGAGIAEETAQVMYGAGVDVSKGLITGLLAEEQKIVSAAELLATSFITAFNGMMATFTVALPPYEVEPIKEVAKVVAAVDPEKILTDRLTNLRSRLGTLGKVEGAAEMATAKSLMSQIRSTAGELTGLNPSAATGVSNSTVVNVTVKASAGVDTKKAGQDIVAIVNRYASASGGGTVNRFI